MIWLLVQLNNTESSIFQYALPTLQSTAWCRRIFRSCPSQLNKQFRPGSIWGLVTARQWEVCVCVCMCEKEQFLYQSLTRWISVLFFFFGFTNTYALLAAFSACRLAVPRQQGQVLLSLHQIQEIREPCLTCELDTWAQTTEFRLKMNTGLGCWVSSDCTIYAFSRCSCSKMTKWLYSGTAFEGMKDMELSEAFSDMFLSLCMSLWWICLSSNVPGTNEWDSIYSVGQGDSPVQMFTIILWDLISLNDA